MQGRYFKVELLRLTAREGLQYFQMRLWGGDPLRGWINPKVIAERMHKSFPEARILICIREQKNTIYSLYSEYIKHGQTVSLGEFIGATGGRPGKAVVCDINQLEYDLLIAHYQSLFGRERVTVLAFEEFIADRRLFLQQLLCAASSGAELSDMPVSSTVKNPSLGPATLKLRRILTKFSKKAGLDTRKTSLLVFGSIERYQIFLI